MIGGALRELGLAPGQELLLMQLWDRDGCSQSDLVDRLGLDPSTVTKMLQRLERDGRVCRSRSGDDGRVTIVSLTEAGRGCAAKSRGSGATSSGDRQVAVRRRAADPAHL